MVVNQAPTRALHLFLSSQVVLAPDKTASLTQSSRARKQVVNSGPAEEASKVFCIDCETRAEEGELVLRRGRRSIKRGRVG